MCYFYKRIYINIFIDHITYEVHQSWIQSKAYPGEAVTLRLRAAPNSLCAISTVDGRIKQLPTDSSYKHGGSINSELVYDRVVHNAISRKAIITEDMECLDCKTNYMFISILSNERTRHCRA